jgi:hypothetical protein
VNTKLRCEQNDGRYAGKYGENSNKHRVVKK